MTFDEVEAVAVIGSVAKSLWKEVPRFREYRRAGIEVWHECKDVDLAVWIASQRRLGELRRTRDTALRRAHESGKGPGTANHQVEIFLIEPRTDRYLGRLCNFSACPKGKPQCRVPGCGAIPFNKSVEGFVPYADLLASAPYAMLYQRGAGVCVLLLISRELRMRRRRVEIERKQRTSFAKGLLPLWLCHQYRSLRARVPSKFR
jgi:hypothetical protein